MERKKWNERKKWIIIMNDNEKKKKSKNIMFNEKEMKKWTEIWRKMKIV